MKNEISKTLKEESNDRKKIMAEVTNNLESYSYRIIELENKIKELELKEIKFKNLERESKELNKIYELKIEETKKLLDKREEENTDIKKELINEKSTVNNLKSLLQVIIEHYNIEEISKVSGLPESKIKEYLK